MFQKALKVLNCSVININNLRPQNAMQWRDTMKTLEWLKCIYRKLSNIRRTKSRLEVAFAQSFKARCLVENEDVVGAAPIGDAPTTSEWSTI